MKALAATVISLSVAAAAGGAATAQTCLELKIARAGSQPSSVKHWHGAALGTAMTHIAIQEHQDGKTGDWLEQVSDARYEGRS